MAQGLRLVYRSLNHLGNFKAVGCTVVLFIFKYCKKMPFRIIFLFLIGCNHCVFSLKYPLFAESTDSSIHPPAQHNHAFDPPPQHQRQRTSRSWSPVLGCLHPLGQCFRTSGEMYNACSSLEDTSDWLIFRG